MSSDALFLAPSSSSHHSHSSRSLFGFLPSICSVSFLFPLVAQVLFCFFLLLLSSFLHFLLFAPFLVTLVFLVSCVLTTSPHFPSSDPSGPETPSFSAYPPRHLLTSYSPLCICSHPGPLEVLISKACLSPWQCLGWYVCMRVCVGVEAGRQALGSLSPSRGGCTVCLPFKLKRNIWRSITSNGQDTQRRDLRSMGPTWCSASSEIGSRIFAGSLNTD